MSDIQPPLVLCIDDINGKEVELQIEQNDTFQMIIDKSKTLLGYDINIMSITGNSQVSLDDNAYTFLLSAENFFRDSTLNSNFDIGTDQTGSDDLVYVLDDGTQIRASQIHFDNDDPHTDLTLEKLPFVKHSDAIDETNDEDIEIGEIKNINITSPASNKNSPKYSFASSLPFRLVCNNAASFEAQFTRYIEERSKTYATLNTANKNKSPRTLINENYKNYDATNRNDFYTREDVLNMFKNSPLSSLPYDSQSIDKRKHVRKTDPSRLGRHVKPLVDMDVKDKHICFICGKIVENYEKLYIFDKDDQILHRCEQKKYTQLKVICERCLADHFVASRLKCPEESLKDDEYLVIKNNQQYIFKKTTLSPLKKSRNPNILNENDLKESSEFVNVEIGPDGEIVTKPITNIQASDVVIINDKKKDSSSDVEIIEPEQEPEIDIDNIDEDENVKEFLGKYQNESDVKELKCRFCNKEFKDVTEVIDHGEEHKHDVEGDLVFPCPLCDYGYANFKWLKGHIKVAHENIKPTPSTDSVEDKKDKVQSPKSSPVAKRTRSSLKKSDFDTENGANENETNQGINESISNELTFTTEVKQECIDSDDSIWIVQTGDNDDELEKLLKVKENETNMNDLKKHKCFKCSKIFPNAESLAAHKCRKRGRRRKILSKDESVVLVPSEEDFMRRAQGRPRRIEDSGDQDLLVERSRKRRNRASSDAQIVTCDNCNESFTSKVRLKFHMQFHDTTNLLTSDGEYKCIECENTKFVTETELFDHVHFQHDKQKRWQCPVKGCGKTFFLRATLTKHSRTHTDTRRYVCVTCGKRFLDKQTLDEHGVTHLQIKPFQCHICLKQLTRRSRLRMHLRAHEEELSPALVLVCGICFRAFRDHNDAQEHANKSTECIAEFTKSLKEESEASEQLSPTSGIVRHSVRNVEGHRLRRGVARQAAGAAGAALLARLDAAARNFLRVVNVDKAFRCEYCEDVFYLEDALNSHRNIHKGIKNPFTCHICKVSFATYSRCTTHKTTHGFYKRSTRGGEARSGPSGGGEARSGPSGGGEARTGPSGGGESRSGPAGAGILGYGGFPVVKHFLCEDCGRSYLHWTYLQVHRRMKHANENYIFKCNQCDMTFPNSWSVTYHRKKVHDNDENGGFTKIVKEAYRIPCRDCDAILPNKTELYKHRKNEHSDESMQTVSQDGGRTTICNQCGHNLHNTFALQKHIDEVHGTDKHGNACPICSRTFRSSSALDEHVRVHSGGMFPCDICEVSFRRSTALKNHKLVHSGVRPFVCMKCPKRFRVRADLRTHARLKHPACVAVLEIEGTVCSPEAVAQHLASNNITLGKVLEITMMSFAKNSTNIVPSSVKALSLMTEVPRTQIDVQKCIEINDIPQINLHIEDAAKTDSLDNGPISYQMDDNNLTNINMELLLQDGGVDSDMVHLNIDDDLLEE